jgi:hypothetical protein
VDEVVVLPGVSYHLDFDVTFRSTGTEWIAFVNDTPAAARQVLALGLTALRRQELLPAAEAERLQTALNGGQPADVVSGLRRFLAAQLGPGGTNAYPATLSRAFVTDPVDDATGNLQIFLVALDLLESALPATRPATAPGAAPAPADERQGYLGALRRMEAVRLAQAEAIQRMGCRVVPVPSMQDLHRSINALNGIQHRDGYILPGYGGFYAPVDQAAAAVFRQHLAPGALITLFRTAECQRRHGAVHCTASVFPRL